MGRGSYSSADWTRLRESTGIHEESTAGQMFKARKMEEKFDPRFIGKREARDNEDHPDSTPVILGLDVTGSMGYLSAEIAKNGLHETMMQIYATKPIADPQLMFAAIGDVNDKAPLQVTQFESDIRIAEQLLQLWLEGCGGDSPEDYELLWYFAAKHTVTDADEKRHKKGFLFTIGDADMHNRVTGEDMKSIFNDETGDLSSRELARMAMEKYELFHIHITSHMDMPSALSGAIPGRVMPIEQTQIGYLPDVIIGAMRYAQGEQLENILAGCGELAAPTVKKALMALHISNGTKGISF